MTQSFTKNQTIYTGSTAPTVTVYTSGSGTYTTPANALFIQVELVGGGGGGGGGGAAGADSPVATAGGNTTFGSLTGSGGTESTGHYVTGLGGAASGGDVNIAGGNGDSSGQNNATNTGLQQNGGVGGSSYFGGAGKGGNIGLGNGGNASTNSGSGGGGGGMNATGGYVAGAGGGAGGYVRKLYNAPSATYSYAIGAGGSGGVSSSTGGNGAAGIIIITEYYQLNTYGTTLTFTGTGDVVKSTAPTFIGNPLGTITSGTYTPSLVNGLNVAASTATTPWQYMRAGNVVTVSGLITIDVTTTVTLSALTATLPVSSTFAALGQCGGSAIPTTAGANMFGIYANAGAATVTFSGTPVSTANESYLFSFTYLIV